MSDDCTGAKVLIIDDEDAWLRNIRLTLQRCVDGKGIVGCNDSRRAEEMVLELRPALVVLDVTMPHRDGIAVLTALKHEWPDLPVVMLTGRDQAEIAVQCMKLGAYDYFIKSEEHERIVSSVRQILHTRELESENRRLNAAMFAGGVTNREAFAPILTRSREMQKVFRYLEAIAPSREPVLIVGESGTGKEMLVKALHQICCADAPLVSVNVAGIDEQVFSDTLFGHVKGAFTGAEGARAGLIEEAGRGILFLDEIGDLGPHLQVKLLRLLQEREYEPIGSDTPRRMQARVVLATNQNLEARIHDGRFREDLFYRLRSHMVRVPPLRERNEDLPLLVDSFVEEAAGELQRKSPVVPGELLPLLRNYDFPGNVRELRALIFEAVSRHQRGLLPLGGFRSLLGDSGAEVAVAPADELHFPANLPTLKQISEALIEEALKRSEGNQATAAALLGISRPALTQRLSKKRREAKG